MFFLSCSVSLSLKFVRLRKYLQRLFFSISQDEQNHEKFKEEDDIDTSPAKSFGYEKEHVKLIQGRRNGLQSGGAMRD